MGATPSACAVLDTPLASLTKEATPPLAAVYPLQERYDVPALERYI
jgi:hypothetical protein